MHLAGWTPCSESQRVLGHPQATAPGQRRFAPIRFAPLEHQPWEDPRDPTTPQLLRQNLETPSKAMHLRPQLLTLRRHDGHLRRRAFAAEMSNLPPPWRRNQTAPKPDAPWEPPRESDRVHRARCGTFQRQPTLLQYAPFLVAHRIRPQSFGLLLTKHDWPNDRGPVSTHAPRWLAHLDRALAGSRCLVHRHEVCRRPEALP